MEELPFISMADPYSSPTFSDTTPGPTLRTRLAFVPGLVRYLGAAALLQIPGSLIATSLIEVRISNLGMAALLLAGSIPLAFGLAPFLYRKLGTKWAVGAMLLGLAILATSLVRFVQTQSVAEENEFFKLPSASGQPFVVTDLRNFVSPPPSFRSNVAFETLLLDTIQLGESGQTIRYFQNMLGWRIGAACTMDHETAVRFWATVKASELDFTPTARRYMCANSIVRMSFGYHDSIYLDSGRVLGCSHSHGCQRFNELRGDTVRFFLPDTMAVRIRHKRDSLRLWREDSARTHAGVN